MIYFVATADGLRVKIGTTIRLSVRLEQLRVKYGEGLNVIAVADGSFVEERTLHREFIEHRIEGEWFHFERPIYDWIEDHGDVWDGTDEVPNDVSVKMDENVVEDCRIASAFKGMSLAEYLSETMRVAAKRDIDDGYAKRAEPPSKGKK